MLQTLTEPATDLTCALRIQWFQAGNIRLDPVGKIQFPAAPSAAGLYRFRIERADGRKSVYVGETDNLSRRFAHYRSPGPTQATNLRLNALFREVLSNEGEIAVDIVTGAAWIAVDSHERQANLSDKATRRLFENMAQCIGSAIDVEALNK